MKNLVILMYGITELFTRTIAECRRFVADTTHPAIQVTSITVMKEKMKMFGDQTEKVHSLKHASLTFTSHDGMPLLYIHEHTSAEFG